MADTQPMEALKPERHAQLHYVEELPGKRRYFEEVQQLAYDAGIEHGKQLADLNTRPATDGQREDIEKAFRLLQKVGGTREVLEAAVLLARVLAATPQAEAAPQFGGMASLVPIKGEGLPYPENFPPPVLASDATLDELLSDAATDAAYAAWEKRENAKGINTWNDCFKDAVKAAWSHRTAHQAAPVRSSTSRPVHIGHSLANDTWFVRYYGFVSTGEAQDFIDRITALETTPKAAPTNNESDAK